MRARIWAVLIGALILSGCAYDLYSSQKIEAGDTSVEVNWNLARYASVPMADYAKAEGFVVIFNDYLLYGEHRQLRTTYEVLAVDEKFNLYTDGVIITDLSEKNPYGFFYGHGKIFVPSRNARIIVLASNASMGFDAYGRAFVIFRSQLGNTDYRKELWDKATPLSELVDAHGFEEITSRWEYRFRLPEIGLIHTPHPKEIINELATKSIGYTAGERASEGKWGVYSNPVPIAVGLVKDTGHTLFGSSKGWDLDSKVSSEEKRFSRKFLEESRESAVIRIYRKENAQ